MSFVICDIGGVYVPAQQADSLLLVREWVHCVIDCDALGGDVRLAVMH